MSIENLPIKEIAKLFNRDVSEVEEGHRKWLTDRKRRNLPMSSNIKLLATLSGLSSASISNFLRGKRESLSEEKYQQLTRLVEIVEYVPNRTAQRLRKQKRNALGVALPLSSVSPEFYLDVLSGIKQEISMSGMHLLIFDITTVQERDEFFDEMPFLNLVDGLVIVNLYISEMQLRLLEQHRLPIVNIHNLFPVPPVVANIYNRNEQALKDLIDQHLIKHHGYKKLALVTLGSSNPLKMGPHTQEDQVRLARIEAYKEALRVNGLSFDERLVFEVNRHSFEEGLRAFDEITMLNKQLPIEQQIEAVVCTSDTLAAAILTSARNKGIKISVTGFDNLPLAELLGVTTIDQKAREVGRLAFRHLVNALNYKERKSSFPPLIEEGVEMKMILRNSCGCPINYGAI